MRVLDDKEVRVQVELTGRELQVIHRALLHVETKDSDLRTEEANLSGEFYDLMNEHNLASITGIE